MRELLFSAVAEADEAQDLASLQRFEQIAAAPSLGALAGEVRKISRAIGFAHYLYGAQVQLPNGDTLQYIFSGYPQSWMDAYQSREYIAIDPIVEHCFRRNSNVPLLWTEQVFDTQERKLFWEDARGHGVASGLSVPVRGANGEVALFSVANAETGKDAMRHQVHVAGTMYLLGAYVHEAVRRLVYQPEQTRVAAPHLTEREIECLKWWISGKTAWEIGLVMHVSERTVRYHVDNIKKKLRVRSKSEVIAMAVRLRIGL